ncbi:unnamed protein product [Timema podura]|uniref:C2H2-type domain-containing protein n=1 Tax=Timema podura TaxID=61482 RepID=A0ABN7NGE8_TIMPD|nr:unnamed protein product [Timema podura]
MLETTLKRHIEDDDNIEAPKKRRREDDSLNPRNKYVHLYNEIIDTMSSYGSLFNFGNFQSELVYRLSDFSDKTVTEIMKFLEERGLAEEPFQETYKLCCLLSTIPMDSGDQDETIDSLAFALSMASNSGSGAGTAVEVFRSAQEASLLNLLRLDAAERQRERRFACPFCGKCVRSKENLKLHVRKHTGERPFVCLFCGRAFGGKSDLTRHLRIHTGERPYHCEMCGKCFARADYLSKHLTTHIHSSQR